MAYVPKKKIKPPKAMMLGVGLDSDGKKRITRGDNFALVGGTQETHEEMTEKAIKINEKLDAKGKQLHEVSREEFDEIAHSVGLHRHKPNQNPSSQD
jgi:hypothetical protein